MKIALLGYGKMGQLIHSIALSKKYEVTSVLNSKNQNWSEIGKADTWIDFSQAQLVVPHLKKALLLNKNIVIGTTGWESQLPLVKDWASKSKIGVLYAPNASLGMLLFLKLLERSAQIMAPFQDYEVGGFEAHHRHKKDTPSGTALEISKRMKKHLQKDVEFTSQRLGSITGHHEVTFDSPFDSITLTHQAKTREGFARGALQAAKWLEGKQGFYTLEDYVEGVLNGS